MGGSLNGGTPIAGWLIFMENPKIKWMIWGTTILGNPHIDTETDNDGVYIYTYRIYIYTYIILHICIYINGVTTSHTWGTLKLIGILTPVIGSRCQSLLGLSIWFRELQVEMILLGRSGPMNAVNISQQLFAVLVQDSHNARCNAINGPLLRIIKDLWVPTLHIQWIWWTSCSNICIYT